ncbi:maltase A3 isoform X1 [Bemisia tabaci]
MRILSILGLSFVISAISAELDWWETSVLYQIFPRSFKDSNGDGIGDLNGIIEKLDYVKDLGVDSIWIQPVYRSPMVDMGYDPISMREIDPVFGTMEDMKELIRTAHEKGLKIVMDFVVNHVSDESEWFKRSVNGEEPYADYFVWHDGKEINGTHKVEPNNWVSMFAESAWSWNEKRQQYYLHQFHAKQPDLNYRNPKVREEMKELFKFWLDLGADGFRIDAVSFLFEAEHLLDEPVKNSTYGGYWGQRRHIYTQHLQENMILVHEWRETLDGYKKRDGKTRLLCVEDINPAKFLFQYYGNETFLAAHFPFYNGLVLLDYKKSATKLDKVIHELVDYLPKNRLPLWVTESHDFPRVSSRFGADAVDAFNMLNLLLPGSACVYYGSEIGLENSLVREDQSTDEAASVVHFDRDRCRGPMPWDDTKNGGFTRNKNSWTPLSSKYWYNNVKAQSEDSESHLKIFKRLMTLRDTSAVKYGDLRTHVVNTWTYMFTRNTNNDSIAVVINLGSESEQICPEDSNFDLPEIMFVYTGSLNSGFKIGDEVRIISAKGHSCAELRPKAGLVLTTYPTSAAIVWSSASWLLILGMGIITLR